MVKGIIKSPTVGKKVGKGGLDGELIDFHTQNVFFCHSILKLLHEIIYFSFVMN